MGRSENGKGHAPAYFCYSFVQLELTGALNEKLGSVHRRGVCRMCPHMYTLELATYDLRWLDPER